MKNKHIDLKSNRFKEYLSSLKEYNNRNGKYKYLINESKIDIQIKARNCYVSSEIDGLECEYKTINENTSIDIQFDHNVILRYNITVFSIFLIITILLSIFLKQLMIAIPIIIFICGINIFFIYSKIKNAIDDFVSSINEYL
jgi:hypothetical protein